MCRSVCRLMVHIGLTVLTQCLAISGALAMARWRSSALTANLSQSVSGCLQVSQEEAKCPLPRTVVRCKTTLSVCNSQNGCSD